MGLTKKVDAALGFCSLIGITVVYLKRKKQTANAAAEKLLKVSQFLRIFTYFVNKINILAQ